MASQIRADFIFGSLARKGAQGQWCVSGTRIPLIAARTIPDRLQRQKRTVTGQWLARVAVASARFPG
jgi:hypothetical protein